MRRDSRHEAPQQSCTCGYYASDSLESLAAARVFGNHGIAVIGAIAMWGSVIQHATGSRSQFAYPARLRLVCTRCIEGGRAVDPTVVIDGSVLRPFCAKHARGQKGTKLPADRVQAELLSAYAVDVLPQPTLPKPRPSDPHFARDAVSMVVGVVFLLLRLVISAMIGLWLLGLALTVVSVVIGGVMGLVHGSDPPPPAPPAAVLPSHPHPYTAHPWRGIEPHRGTPPIPDMALPCGAGHGSWVELVPCGDPRADLLGIAMDESPRGRAHDCASPNDAYSSAPDWWICWFDVSGSAWVNPWPDSANPFAPAGGVSDGDR
jgi:hypothetical protein